MTAISNKTFRSKCTVYVEYINLRTSTCSLHEHDEIKASVHYFIHLEKGFDFKMLNN